MKRIILIALGAIVTLSSVNAQNFQRFQSKDVKETYQYAQKDTNNLCLDRIYNPEKFTPDKKMPAMIFMFGGGWAFGARGGNYSYLTDIGIQVISIDYRLGLKAYGYGPSPDDVFKKAVHMGLDDLTDAMAYVIAHADEWNIDKDKIMLSGSSAGAINTLMSIYDICTDGPYSKKFPEGWMPAGYIGYAGAVIDEAQDLVWKKKPCPLMFFHGSGDQTVAFDVQRRSNGNVFGPMYIIKQLEEMEVPYYLYVEDDADHVLSYKGYSGYNFNEIHTFIEKLVLQGLPLRIKTEEYNMVEPSHLPGMPAHPRKAQNEAK